MLVASGQICSYVVDVLVCRGAKMSKAERDNALNSQVTLRSHHHLRSWALARQK